MPAVREEDLLRNLYGFYSSRAKTTPGARVVEDRGLLLIDSGLPAPELNIAFVTGEVGDEREAVRRAQRFAGRSGYWRFEAPVASAAEFAPLLTGIGLTQTESRPAFTLAREDLRPGEPPAELEIVQVTSPGERRQFYETVSLGFSGRPLPPSLPAERIEVEGSTAFLGLYRGQPATTAMLYVRSGVAGIYAVATVPGARRSGLGRAVSAEAVRHGFRLGCRVAFLQSTEMAISVYRAIGFLPSFVHAVWRTPAPRPP